MAMHCDVFRKEVVIFIVILIFLPFSIIKAQDCPANIDFENGTFSNWTCLIGNVTALGPKNIISLIPNNGPAANRHTIISKAASSGVKDFYGGFPVLCPNGSNYCVKLGNTNGGHEAEGISYELTIPANRNTYSLIYNYAVVFSNPDHLFYQQPRFAIEVKNVTDNSIISCSSATFIPYGSPLPGFFVSPKADSIWCKDWTPVTINLNGNAGKTIRITFLTTDCTFFGHFGYAYVDVNTDCGGELRGAKYCKEDTAVNLTGPYGFSSYNWYNQNFTKLISTQQNLSINPPPPKGTVYALELIPFNGYGCIDTLFVSLSDTLAFKANAGADAVICGNNTSALLGENAIPDAIYSWLPADGLSNPAIANPVVTPLSSPATYVLTVSNTTGGCRNTDTVIVKKSMVDTAVDLLGKNIFCTTSGDSAVLNVKPGNSVQWLNNGNPISGENKFKLHVLQSGSYQAELENNDGCISKTRTEIINIHKPPEGITYPLLFVLTDNPLTLESRSFGGTANWGPGIYLDNPSVSNPVFNCPVETDLQYRINIETSDGCFITDYQPVKIIKEINIFLPNAFTPNSDGINDYLHPVTVGATVNSFKVFNRFGQEIFSIDQNEKGWDGTFKGIGQEKGVYVWYLKGRGIDNKMYTKKGTVLLIR